ncbi:hypothetical protein [Streptomyces sp. NBC_01262]|uniref:hypothetical protein n=1 Tax=Streptomyces sp. NBC_01262 TaxID=2903803 RepID=UPI002E32F067|nr:hypothetical protein [Streptomyces sp. NBC_01262]
MAQVLKMPTTTELPDSPQRKFVEELFAYYRDAGRPALRIITDDIAAQFDAFTASRETIRRMLRGKTVPVNWQVVDAVLTVLCARANIDPDTERWEGSYDDSPTHRKNLRNLWNEALDAPPPPPAQASGWGAPARSYSDEPPF